MRLFKVFTLLSCIGLLFAPAALGETLTSQSKIVGVTVFPSGANITRTLKVKVPKGDHEIVIGDLPKQAIRNSIRVSGEATGDFLISSVDTRRLSVLEADKAGDDGARKALEEKLKGAREKRALIVADIDTAKTKKLLIKNLTNIPNHPTGRGDGDGQAPDWSGLLSLISTELASVQRDIIESEKQLRDVDVELKDLKKQLGALKPPRVQRTEVKVFAQAQDDVEATLTIKYQVTSASWTPIYDARLASGGADKAPTLALTRRAKISNRTGEDWTEIATKLSTTRPHSASSAPKLRELIVDFRQPVAELADAMPAPRVQKEKRRGTGGGLMSQLSSKPTAPKKRVAARQQRSKVTQAPFQAVYTVPGVISVTSNGVAKNVTLSAETLSPKIRVRSVPSRSTNAYLYAELTVPKGAPILPGQVSLFRDGTFVGQGYFPLVAGEEEHELGFGVDDSVRITYAVEKDKRGEQGLISSSRTDDRNFKITIKNLHERAIDVAVLDRMPVSKNEEIRVTLLGPTKPTKTDLKDKRGILTWQKKLEPGAEKTIKFGYQVVWPGDKSIRYGR